MVAWIPYYAKKTKAKNYAYGFLTLVICIFIFNFFIYSPPKPPISDVAGTYTLSPLDNKGWDLAAVPSRLVFKPNGICDLNVPNIIQDVPDGSSTGKLIRIHGKWHLEQEGDSWRIAIEKESGNTTNSFSVALVGDKAPYKLALPFGDPDMENAFIFVRE